MIEFMKESLSAGTISCLVRFTGHVMVYILEIIVNDHVLHYPDILVYNNFSSQSTVNNEPSKHVKE